MTPRMRLVLVPGLMLAVAAIQFRLSMAGTLTPWKGGGFGMFSTIDGDDHRALRVTVEARGGAFPVDPATAGIAPSLLREARGFPGESRLRRLAVALASTAPVQALAPERLRIEVLRLKYDPRSGSAALVPLAHFDWSPP